MNTHEAECPARASACVLVIREPDLVLAVWNKRHECFGLPGGKREPADRNIRATASRELHEETDLLAGRLVWLCEGGYQPVDTSQLDFMQMHLYHAWGVQSSPVPKETTLAWMEWDWLLKAATAFRTFYETALPEGIIHLKPTVFG